MSKNDIIISFTEGYDSLCPTCQSKFDRFVRRGRGLHVSVFELFKKKHFWLAHFDYVWECDKSKLRGPFRDVEFLQEFLETTVPWNGWDGDLQQLLSYWVHEEDRNGWKYYGFRFLLSNSTPHPEDSIVGAFARGGRVWHQHRLEAWFTEEGEIASVFPSGFGENGNQARPYTPCQEGERWPFYPNSDQCVAVRECKFILISAWSYFCLQTMMTSFLGIPFTAPVHS